MTLVFESYGVYKSPNVLDSYHKDKKDIIGGSIWSSLKKYYKKAKNVYNKVKQNKLGNVALGLLEDGLKTIPVYS